MPYYNYICSECESKLKIFHGMKERYKVCPTCNEESLKRDYSVPISYSQEKEEKLKPGDIVKRSIEDFRQEVEEEKKKLKEKEYYG